MSSRIIHHLEDIQATYIQPLDSKDLLGWMDEIVAVPGYVNTHSQIALYLTLEAKETEG